MSDFISKHIFLPDTIIVDIKLFCLQETKRLTRSYRVYEFTEAALAYLSGKKIKQYYCSFVHNERGISEFLINFRKPHLKILNQCISKAASETQEAISERRVILTAILAYLEKNQILDPKRLGTVQA